MHAQFDAGKLGSAFGSFWHRLRIPLAGVAGESSDYVEALERVLGGELDVAVRGLPLMKEAEWGRLHVLGLAAVHKSQNELSRRPLDDEAARILMGRLERLGFSYWRVLPDLDIILEGYPCDLSWQPGMLVRACHATLRDQPFEQGLTALDQAALALIGATVLQVARTKRCNVCFRWALPGTQTCREHSATVSNAELSKLGAELELDRQLAIARAGELSQRIYGDVPDEFRPQHGRCMTSAMWLSRTLWPVAGTHERRIVDLLMRRLPSLPGVLAEMHTTPARLRRESLLLRLQRHIDPLELRPDAWLDLIEQANVWNQYRGRFRHTGRCTERTNELVRRAIEAAGRPGTSRNSVARELGVAPTLLTKWLSRYPEEPAIQRLAALLGMGRRTAFREDCPP